MEAMKLRGTRELYPDVPVLSLEELDALPDDADLPLAIIEAPEPTAEQMLSLYAIYRQMGSDPIPAMERLLAEESKHAA